MLRMSDFKISKTYRIIFCFFMRASPCTENILKISLATSFRASLVLRMSDFKISKTYRIIFCFFMRASPCTENILKISLATSFRASLVLQLPTFDVDQIHLKISIVINY